MSNALHIRKVPVQWVLRLLTPKQKQDQKKPGVEMLQLSQANSDDFFDHLITMHESRVYQNNFETKKQNTNKAHELHTVKKSEDEVIIGEGYH